MVVSGVLMILVGTAQATDSPRPRARLVSTLAPRTPADDLVRVRVRLTNPTLVPVTDTVSGDCCSLDGSTYLDMGPLPSKEVTAQVTGEYRKDGTRIGSVGVSFVGPGLDRRIGLPLSMSSSQLGGSK